MSLNGIRTHIGKNKLQQAIGELEALLQEEGMEEFRNSLIVLSRRWEEIRQQELEGTTDGNQLQIKKNELAKSLVGLTEQFESFKEGTPRQDEPQSIDNQIDESDSEPIWKKWYSILAMIVLVGISMFLLGRSVQPGSKEGNGLAKLSLIDSTRIFKQQLEMAYADSGRKDSVISALTDSISSLMKKPAEEPEENDALPVAITQELNTLRARNSQLRNRNTSLSNELKSFHTHGIKEVHFFSTTPTWESERVRTLKNTLESKGITVKYIGFASSTGKARSIRLRSGTRGRNFNLFAPLFESGLIKSINFDDNVGGANIIQVHID